MGKLPPVMLKSIITANLCNQGRILNRFTKDMANIDTVLPWTLIDFLQVRILREIRSFH
jgi:hypothetical protein